MRCIGSEAVRVSQGSESVIAQMNDRSRDLRSDTTSYTGCQNVFDTDLAIWKYLPARAP